MNPSTFDDGSLLVLVSRLRFRGSGTWGTEENRRGAQIIVEVSPREATRGDYRTRPSGYLEYEPHEKSIATRGSFHEKVRAQKDMRTSAAAR